MCLGPGNPNILVGAVGGGIGLFVIGVLIFAFRYFLKKRNENNDNGEQRHLVRNDAVIHNAFGELNPADRSRPLPIGSSHAKADVNVLRSVHS